MARAVDENGELIILANYTRFELRKIEKKKYYCLTCNKRLVLKVGERNRPHFSHNSSFGTKKQQGESDHHKLATHLLYQSFKKQNFKTEREYYIAKINQRPDVVVFSKDKAYAFEFQSSQISLISFRKRTLNLKKAGFEPIWLLSSNFLKLKTNSIIKLTPFIAQFIHRFSHQAPPQLFFLNPEKQQVIIIEHILFLSTQFAFVQKRVIPLANLTFIELKKHSLFNVKHLFTLWKKEKYKFRTKVRSSSRGYEYHWRSWLYQQNIHFEALPAIIHLPTRHNYYFKTPPWNWQSRLYLQVIYPLKINQTFSYQDCLNVLAKYIIPQTDYPLIEMHANPLKKYLNLLTHLKVIKALSNNRYSKLKNIPLINQLEKSIIADDDIIKQLLYNLK